MVREREGDEKRCVQGKYSGKQSYKTEKKTDTAWKEGERKK